MHKYGCVWTNVFVQWPHIMKCMNDAFKLELVLFLSVIQCEWCHNDVANSRPMTKDQVTSLEAMKTAETAYPKSGLRCFWLRDKTIAEKLNCLDYFNHNNNNEKLYCFFSKITSFVHDNVLWKFESDDTITYLKDLHIFVLQWTSVSWVKDSNWDSDWIFVISIFELVTSFFWLSDSSKQQTVLVMINKFFWGGWMNEFII